LFQFIRGDPTALQLRAGFVGPDVELQPLLGPDVDLYNPAFDVTPAELVTAIITERGVVKPPYGPGLRRAVGGVEIT
jgi:methylthioribose-1-phosphate isomerase